MKEITIASKDASQRLDKYLKRIFPEMGTSFLYKMLRKKNITLNGKKASGSEIIQTGDLVQCFFSDETFAKFSGKNEISDTLDNEYKKAFESIKNISIIYEDEHILLLNKPAGILSQKAMAQDISINEWMIGYLLSKGDVSEASLKEFKPSVCNRLDRNTSGLVICGKTLLGSREMSRVLKDRSLQKYYRTYVHGILNGKKKLEGYHQKDKNTNQAKIYFSKPLQNPELYDSIITVYQSLEIKSNYSYLEIELVTGKTHQIRAHLAAYGHPIVGDSKYGKCSSHVFQNRKSSYDKIQNNRTDSRKDIHADFPKFQLLHAYRIVFPMLEGELNYLSNKEFICEEPITFKNFRKQFFK